MCTLRWYESARSAFCRSGLELVTTVDNPIDACWTDRPAPASRRRCSLPRTFTGESSMSKRARIGAELAQRKGRRGADIRPGFRQLAAQRTRPRRAAAAGAAELCDARGGRSLHLVDDPRRIPEGSRSTSVPGVTVVDEADAAALLAAGPGADRARRSGYGKCLDPAALRRGRRDPAGGRGSGAAAQGLQERDGDCRRPGGAPPRCGGGDPFSCLAGSRGRGRQTPRRGTLADRLGVAREGEHFHEPSFDTISAAAAERRHVPLQPPRQRAGHAPRTASTWSTAAASTPTAPRTSRAPWPSVRDGGDARAVHPGAQGAHRPGRARFPRGTTGTHLDVLARQFLWQTGRDYDHGTGHGVGAFLSVHEGPQRISRAWNPRRWRRA
jgi:Xaa-Pro aminopeptidase